MERLTDITFAMNSLKDIMDKIEEEKPYAFIPKSIWDAFSRYEQAKVKLMCKVRVTEDELLPEREVYIMDNLWKKTLDK